MRLDPIVIGPYDPSWPASFDAQQSQITPVLAPWLTRDIEHMGSTAVPGLPAKDIVDMLAVVAVIQPVRSAIEPMAVAGWLQASVRSRPPARGLGSSVITGRSPRRGIADADYSVAASTRP